jgi:alkanesulfonate monooxygenase SsuD/methylene tetrahydromethanopterin reductase-like flavin-dependent oxidoreductase (luciferase family)
MELELCLDWGSMSRSEYAEYARYAEELGFGTLWIPNSRYYQDMWVASAFVATLTSHVRIGTFILDPFSTSAIVAATAAASLDLVAEGRLVLAVGAGSASRVINPQGRHKPVETIRNFISEIRAQLSNRSEASIYQNPELPTIGFGGREAIAIDVAGRGPRVLQLGATVGDRVQIATMASPEVLNSVLQRVPSLRETALGIRVDVCIGPTESAVEAIKPILALALQNSMPSLGFLHAAGITTARISEREVSGLIGARRFVSDLPSEAINRLALAGPRSFVTERLSELAECGLVEFLVIVPHGNTHVEARDTVLAIAEWWRESSMKQRRR